jgi:hypothetical protein
MTTSSADRWKTVAGQIRLTAVWCMIGSSWFGLELAAAMWRPRDVFYPFPLIFWGLITVFYLYRVIVYLSQLSYTVPLAYANEKRKELRPLGACIVGAACVSFAFTMCSVAGKSFGAVWIGAAVALGLLTILMIFVLERKIKQIGRTFYSADASVT